MKLLSTLAAAAVTLMLGASVAYAVDPNPKDRVDSVYASVKTATMSAENQDQLIREVTHELDALIDYQAFAARTLKTSWPTLSEAQRAQFIDKFKQLVIRTYAKRFTPKAEFSVEHRGDVAFLNPDKTEAKVATTVRGKKVAADVDYYFAYTGKGSDKAWRAYDFVIDDVSMSLNWRGQFEKILAKEGFDALIAKIEKKVSKPE